MKQKRSLLKGALAGAIGGALGTVVLNLVQSGSLEGTRKVEDLTGTGHQYSEEQKQLLGMYEQAHVATAEAAGAKVPAEKRQPVAMGVEFAFGIVCAAVYGAMAEYVSAVTLGFGGVYGAALFAGASEVVLPAIRFVPSPADRTAVQHVGGLTGNVVYGVVTEATRRLLRPRL